MSTQVLDDGTVVTTDDTTGDVTSTVTNAGVSLPVTPPDGGITAAFTGLVTNGVTSLTGVLTKAVLPKPGVVAAAPAPGAAAAAQVTSLLANPTVKIVGLGLLAALLYKKFA